MELYAPGLLAIDTEGSCRYILCASYDTEALGELSDRVSVRHPYGRPLGDPLHQRIVGVVDREVCTPVLTAVAWLYLATCLMDYALRPIADP